MERINKFLSGFKEVLVVTRSFAYYDQ